MRPTQAQGTNYRRIIEYQGHSLKPEPIQMPRLFVKRLTVIDSAYLDPLLGLVGTSLILDLELEGSLDPQGMILDFGLIKETVKAHIDEVFDHRLLVPRQHPGCHVRHQGETIEIEFHYGTKKDQHRLLHSSPAEGLCLLPLATITPDSLAGLMRKQLMNTMPPNVSDLGIRLREEAIEGACYSYSHGLKQHQGKCRRIAHGHRSRLEVLRNGQPAPELARAWADAWQNIYLANSQDLLWSGDIQNEPGYRFGYTTVAGDFLLELPQNRCALLKGDTTVENIAEHIARQIARQIAKTHPGDEILVKAYEGLDKGAWASGLSGKFY